jgi:hypothetical protein
MTANDWVHNSNYDIPFEVKDGFTLLAGYMERYLSNKYEYETEWDRNEDVFIRIFDNYPIDKTHRKIALRVSFHKRFIEVCYEGLVICNMYISTTKAPVVGFRSAPKVWKETHKIQETFGQLFQNIFKQENVI